jgi:transposase
MDSTSVTLFGQYEGADDNFAVPEYGYSRDKRPDLKQVVLTLVAAGSAGVPLWHQMEDGNQPDKTGFHDTIERVTSGLKETQDFLWVADGTLYSKKHLQDSTIRWLTRVPGTLKLAKQYQQQTLVLNDVSELNAKNRGMMVDAPISEQWLLVLSQEGRKREEKTLEKRIIREEEKLNKYITELSRERFACVPDTVTGANKFVKSLKWGIGIVVAVELITYLKMLFAA